MHTPWNKAHVHITCKFLVFASCFFFLLLFILAYTIFTILSNETIEVMLVMRCVGYLNFLIDCVGCAEVVFKPLSNWVVSFQWYQQTKDSNNCNNPLMQGSDS